MRITIIHDEVSAQALPDERDNLIAAEAIREALVDSGHEVVALACSLNLEATAAKLRLSEPDIVFNLVESIGETGRLSHVAASLCETMGLPYTGCPADSLYLTSNKLLAKKYFRLFGIPSPDWTDSDSIVAGRPLPSGTLIIKSVWEHASIGIDETSLICPDNSEQLLAELKKREPRLGRNAYAERFVDGREFNIALFENRNGVAVLPPAEICFVDYGGLKPRIVDYRAKWEADSFEYNNTPRRFEFPADDTPLIAELGELALKCWETFGLRGYARVDFRVDERGRPFVLEINANPCLSPDAGFSAAVSQAGLTYREFIDALVHSARTPRQSDTPAIAVSSDETRRLRDTLEPKDCEAIEILVRGTGFFSEAEVDIARELVEEYFDKGSLSGYHFVLCDIDEKLAAYACYGPIPGTLSSFDLYWIAVDRAFQRRHLGRFVLAHVEKCIQAMGGTRVYIDSSGRSSYRPTQAFYLSQGYAIEAVFDNFYGPSDPKIVYLKQLTSE